MAVLGFLLLALALVLARHLSDSAAPHPNAASVEFVFVVCLLASVSIFVRRIVIMARRNTEAYHHSQSVRLPEKVDRSRERP